VALERLDDVASGGIFLVMEGGQFVWPGIEKGFTRTMTFHDSAPLSMETLELQPLVLQINGFLTDEEASKVVERSRDHVKPSGVTMSDADKARGKKNTAGDRNGLAAAGL
jgi:prolyl 4-hydroxylase